jgi:hypothetical protein
MDQMRAFQLALIAIATVAAAACSSSESKRAHRHTQTRATATQVATTTRPALPPQKMGLTEWRAAMVRAAPPACSDSSSAERTTLGGEPALVWTATCSD